jgi:hypothetical protein
MMVHTFTSNLVSVLQAARSGRSGMRESDVAGGWGTSLPGPQCMEHEQGHLTAERCSN